MAQVKRQALVIAGIEAVKTARMAGVEVMTERMGGEVFTSAGALVLHLEGDGVASGVNQLIERLRDHGVDSFSRCFPRREERSRCVGHALGTRTETCANCCAAVAFYKP